MLLLSLSLKEKFVVLFKSKSFYLA